MPPVIRSIGFHDADFKACFDVRVTVFVTEQNVPIAEEQDEFDETAAHFLAELDGKPVGTARLLMKENGTLAKITRVAVLREARGQNIGAALIRHIEATAPVSRFALDAQVHALPFYERLGYKAVGDVFMEAGIPHRHMRKDK